MKVVLKTGKEYQVSSVSLMKETQLCIGFTGITSYDTLRADLTVDSMKQIKYYTGEVSFTSYENFTKFATANTTVSDDGTLNVAMYFNSEDEISQRISILEDTVDMLVISSLGV